MALNVCSVTLFHHGEQEQAKELGCVCCVWVVKEGLRDMLVFRQRPERTKTK